MIARIFPLIDPTAGTTLDLLVFFFAVSGIAVLIAACRQGGQDANLLKRYRSWYMIAPAVIIPAYFGGVAFAGLVCALSLVCLREFFNVSHVRDFPAYKWTGRICGVLIAAAALLDGKDVPPALSHTPLLPVASPSHLAPILQSLHPFYVLPVFMIMVVLMIPIFLQTYEGMLAKEAFTIFGIMYFGWFLAHLVFLRQLDGGFGYVIFLCMTVVFNDVLAYSVGRLIGRRPLVGRLSPKKTVEGFFGGAAGSVAAALVFRYAVPALTLPWVLGAGLLIGVAAPLGDLVISVIKRDMSVKDSGNLIPGHGGLLDRCDSLIFATPGFYYYLALALPFTH